MITSGGPAKKMVPLPLTITFSSDMAGTYAPPAVHDPKTTAIYKKIMIRITKIFNNVILFKF